MPAPSDESPPSNQSADAARLGRTAREPSHLAPAPRVIPPSVQRVRESQVESSGSPLPPEVNEALEWLRRHGDADPESAEPPDEAASTKQPTRALLPKQQRKFHKFDPEHLTPAPVEDGGSGSLPGQNADENAHGVTPEQLAALHRLRHDSVGRIPWVPLAVAALFFLGLVVAFVFRHTKLSNVFAANPAPVAAPDKSMSTANVLSAGVLDLIDQAMAAETAKDYPKALELLEQARRDAGHIYGADYHLARLCYRANAMPRVMPLLNLSIIEGEEVAACCNLRGALANQDGGPDQGLDDLEKATQIDPFNAHYAFTFGEALRRAGKPGPALAQLRRALNRLREPALVGPYSLKARLTQLELGQADEVEAETTDKLKFGAPSADWLLTAAAVEMHRGEFPKAAAYLNTVRALIGNQEMAQQLQDAYFTNFAREKPLTEFFDVPVPRTESTSL